jgi:hypothetical protein
MLLIPETTARSVLLKVEMIRAHQVLGLIIIVDVQVYGHVQLVVIISWFMKLNGGLPLMTLSAVVTRA